MAFMEMCRGRLSLSLVCLCVLFVPCLAMFDVLSYVFTSSDEFDIIWSFSFDKGGVFDLIATVNEEMVTSNSTAQLLLCSNSCLDKIRQVPSKEVCAHDVFDAAPTTWQATIGGDIGNELSTLVNIDERSWFYLLQLNCGKHGYTLDLSIEARNPGGYLSLSEAPFQVMYKVLAVLWSLLALVWFVHFIRYYHFNITLQSLLLTLPLLFAAFSVPMLFFWQESNETGHHPKDLYWGAFALGTLGRAVQYGVLMLIGRGWAIVRKKLSKEEARQIAGMCAAVAVCYVCFVILGGIALFALVLMYVACMRYVFASVAILLQDIEEQTELLTSAGASIAHTPLDVKRRMYKKFHLIVLAYISFTVIFHLWASIFLMTLPWLADLIDTVFDMALIVALCYVFHLRPFRPCFYFAPSAVRSAASRRESMGAPLIADDIAISDLESGNNEAPVWEPGLPLPYIPSDFDYAPWLHPYSEELIIIENDAGPVDADKVPDVQIGRPVC